VRIRQKYCVLAVVCMLYLQVHELIKLNINPSSSVVEQWVLFMVRRQTWQARRFEIFESARHFRIESNRDVRFEFESNLEALQVPRWNSKINVQKLVDIIMWIWIANKFANFHAKRLNRSENILKSFRRGATFLKHPVLRPTVVIDLVHYICCIFRYRQ